jgi:DNA mismatch repair ATPase MutS
VELVGELDGLLSLAESSAEMARPVFVDSSHSLLDVRDMRHPLICET